MRTGLRLHPDFGDFIVERLYAFLDFVLLAPAARAHGFPITETDPGWHRFGQGFDREIWQAQL